MPTHVTTFPVVFQRPTTSDLTEAIIDAALLGDNTIIAAVASQTIRVHKIFFVTASVVNVTIKNGAGANLTGAMNNLRALTLDLDGQPWFTTTAGNAFIIRLSAAVQISGRVYYEQTVP